MTRLIGVVASFCVVSSASAIVLNGGFETQGTGDATDAAGWEQLEIAGGGSTALTDRSAAMPHTGDWAMDFAVDGSAAAQRAVIRQQTLIGSVVPGQSYTFEFWAKGSLGPGAIVIFQVDWFDGDGDFGGDQSPAIPQTPLFPLFPNYVLVGGPGVLVAPAAADSVIISIQLVAGVFVGSTGWMTVDDVRFVPVPGPCVGDLDGDGDTDVFDFGIFASNFGASGLPPFTGGDLDGDGDVDVFDFGIFATDFGCTP